MARKPRTRKPARDASADAFDLDLDALIESTSARLARNPAMRELVDEIRERLGRLMDMLEEPDAEARCSECGELISTHRMECPHCGIRCAPGAIHDCPVLGIALRAPGTVTH